MQTPAMAHSFNKSGLSINRFKAVKLTTQNVSRKGVSGARSLLPENISRLSLPNSPRASSFILSSRLHSILTPTPTNAALAKNLLPPGK